MNAWPRASVAARILTLLLLVLGISTSPRGATASLLASAVIVVGSLLLIRPEPRALSRRALLALLGVAAIAAPILLVDPERAALLATRALLATLVALAIASTIPSARLGAALSSLGVPRGISAVIASLLRQVGSIAAEGRRLALARSLRGARGVGASTEMLAALLARSATRAERVELALRLRGYDERERPEGVPLAFRDAPTLAIATIAALGVHLVALV